MIRRLSVGALALAICAAAAIWWIRPPDDRIVLLSHETLNSASAESLAPDYRVEFDDVVVDWADGVRFTLIEADPADWAIGAMVYGPDDVRVTLVQQ